MSPTGRGCLLTPSVRGPALRSLLPWGCQRSWELVLEDAAALAHEPGRLPSELLHTHRAGVNAIPSGSLEAMSGLSHAPVENIRSRGESPHFLREKDGAGE